MSHRLARPRVRLALVVWAVLVSQVLLYPGLDGLIAALGAPGGIRAGMWFLVAEFAAFVTFAVAWGAASDSLGRRTPLVVAGALGGAACYLLLPQLPALGVGFGGVLLLRVLGGAFTIGAFSLGITMLMDLAGGNGRNMGAAGIAIGLGAALGSVVGGQLAAVDSFAPVYAGAVVLVAAAGVAATVRDTVAAEATVGTADSDADRNGNADLTAPSLGVALATLRSRPSLAVPYAFGFIDRLTAGFFSLVGVFYFGDVFGLDAAGVGVALALFFLPFALLQYPLGSLSDRIGRFIPVVVGSIGYGIAIIAVGAAPIVEVAMALMVLVGVAGAFVAPATMALVSDLCAPAERGVAMGGFNVFGSLGFLTGFLLGGVVADATTYLTAFLVVGGLEIGIALFALPAVRRLTRESSSPTQSPAEV
ncbi:MFS transporter [Halonotius terrestris]|uniref:MFS transporter n=1 Tax=Halonotius terrestris TaxID=2487750 RepID=A0A8J8TB73_9EURY|nr:MFS transporter [Halonotius terrestris]TQQ79805.1 MFS transporter [Halonotius terrestris]